MSMQYIANHGQESFDVFKFCLAASLALVTCSRACWLKQN